ncbi:LysR family transcriptional regulator [Agarivorans sp. MS3-6]|uniref:LysR family transcriptional regulator n=1 Tax=Agarivorans sp. TSD2052 TaxID=2937286 RepID=UPI00200EDEDB|nr:LysR family transcriptional regulator [Agarivorans sp. TSD2052]UPW16738.1 LysR family transcriptional regulator [Agarivorans sp. TSD2052]
MNFSLEQLQAFVAVYEERSFSKAAIKLDKHRTTVGQVVANLEDMLAVELFQRTPRVVEPTLDAKLLYHYAKQALEQAKTFDKVALSLSFGELDSITIAYSSFIPHTVLALIRQQLAVDYPRMRVNLIVRSQAEIRAGFEQETIHFAIVNVTNAKAMSNISYTLLGGIDFVPYVSKDSEVLNMSDDEQYAALKSTRQFVLKSLLDENMNSLVVLSANYDEVDQLAMTIKLVQMNLGWTALPKRSETIGYISKNLVRVQCTKVRNGISIPIALWCPHSKPILEIKKSLTKAIDEYTKSIASS